MLCRHQEAGCTPRCCSCESESPSWGYPFGVHTTTSVNRQADKRRDTTSSTVLCNATLSTHTTTLLYTSLTTVGLSYTTFWFPMFHRRRCVRNIRPCRRQAIQIQSRIKTQIHTLIIHSVSQLIHASTRDNAKKNNQHDDDDDHHHYSNSPDIIL